MGRAGIPVWRRGAYCGAMVDENSIRLHYGALHARLDERGRRLFAAAEARTAGHGGVAAAARARGIARSTIGRGLKDLEASGVAEEMGHGRGHRGKLTNRRNGCQKINVLEELLSRAR
jgi:DNA-binding phage protein